MGRPESNKIESRIERMELIEWSRMPWLQTEEFKHVDEEEVQQLKRSLIENGFILPFAIGRVKGKDYILDGRSRKIAMNQAIEDGVKVPSKLPALRIAIKNAEDGIKAARKIVLIYTARYGSVQRQGLIDFTKGMNRGALIRELKLPGMKELKTLFELGSKNSKKPEKKKKATVPIDTVPAFHVMKFSLTRAQKKTIERALKLAASLGSFEESANRSTQSNALERICTSFIAEHGEGETQMAAKKKGKKAGKKPAKKARKKSAKKARTPETTNAGAPI